VKTPNERIEFAPYARRRYLDAILGFICALISTPVSLYALVFAMVGADARFPKTLPAWTIIGVCAVAGGAVSWLVNGRWLSLLLASIAGPILGVICLLWLGA
jgi:hypothetical protein